MYTIYKCNTLFGQKKECASLGKNAFGLPFRSREGAVVIQETESNAGLLLLHPKQELGNCAADTRDYSARVILFLVLPN